MRNITMIHRMLFGVFLFCASGANAVQLCVNCKAKYLDDWTDSGTKYQGIAIYQVSARLPTASRTYSGACETSCYGDTYAPAYSCKGPGVYVVSNGAQAYNMSYGGSDVVVYADKSSVYCYRCPNGSYSDVAYGVRTCKLCPGGYLTTGGSECSTVTCAGFEYTETWLSPSWTNNTVNGSVSNLCVATKCKAGAYLDGTVCKGCPAGTYSTTVGATSSSVCTPCPSPADVYTTPERSVLAPVSSPVGSSAVSQCYIVPGTYYDTFGEVEYMDGCTY